MNNDILQWIAVAVILIAAIVYIIKRFRRKNKGCGCGCDGCHLKNKCKD